MVFCEKQQSRMSHFLTWGYRKNYEGMQKWATQTAFVKLTTLEHASFLCSCTGSKELVLGFPCNVTCSLTLFSRREIWSALLFYRTKNWTITEISCSSITHTRQFFSPNILLNFLRSCVSKYQKFSQEKGFSKVLAWPCPWKPKITYQGIYIKCIQAFCYNIFYWFIFWK